VVHQNLSRHPVVTAPRFVARLKKDAHPSDANSVGHSDDSTMRQALVVAHRVAVGSDDRSR
jgi:hypothetical protein